MYNSDKNNIPLAIALIHQEFAESNDVEETQWKLAKKLGSMLQEETIDSQTFTILYWYICGYRDGFGEGAKLE